jgi:hypothetical protein
MRRALPLTSSSTSFHAMASGRDGLNGFADGAVTFAVTLLVVGWGGDGNEKKRAAPTGKVAEAAE